MIASIDIIDSELVAFTKNVQPIGFEAVKYEMLKTMLTKYTRLSYNEIIGKSLTLNWFGFYFFTRKFNVKRSEIHIFFLLQV